MVLRPSVDCLNHGLGVGTIVWPDRYRIARGRRESGRGVCNGVEIGSLGWGDRVTNRQHDTDRTERDTHRQQDR